MTIRNPEYPEIFQYDDIDLPEEGAHKISPSQIGQFFDYPKLWYQEVMEHQTSEFQGNTSTVTGTICHWILEQVALNKPVDREEINQQLLKYVSMRPELGLDVDDIMINYPLVASTMVNDYLLKAPKDNVEVEKKVCIKVDDGVYLAGTLDRIEGSVLVDYKTASIKPNENEISFGYRIQLLAYAYALRQMGYTINRIRLVYGVRPTKTLPARCFVVTKQIDEADEKLIQDTIKLICESVIICRNRPELIHLIFKSMDLKQ